MAICYCKDCKNAFVSHTDEGAVKCPKCEKECLVLSENSIKENRDSIYLSAMHKKQVALYPRDIDEARELFAALGKYRDSIEQIESCDYLASRMRERELAEEKAASLSPEKIKRVAKTVVAVIVIIGILTTSLLLLISPLKYASAKKSFEKGELEKASELFAEIADYKDSKDYLKRIYDSLSEKEGKKVSCSALEPYFSVSADGAIIFTRSQYKGDGNIIIPAVFDGVSVNEIEKNCFKNYTKLTSVIIPDSVTEISDYAFYGCTSIKEIKLPDGVKTIGQYAFMGCSSLETINIPEGVTSINSYAFASCTSLTFPTLPESLTKIDSSAFLGCTSFEKATLPQNVSFIGAHAFDGCVNMSEITLSAKTEEIGDSAFGSCDKLQSVIYMGTAEEFEKIKIGDGNKTLTDATIKFTAK